MIDSSEDEMDYDADEINRLLDQARRIGRVVTTIHGNKLRRFEDGWSPLRGANWDRWTVYTDEELWNNFTLVESDRHVIGQQED